MNEKERISMTYEICGEPCKPIVNELNSRDDKLKLQLEKTAEQVKTELEKSQSIIHVKLDGIYTCLASKIPSRLFWRVVTMFSVLIFGICGAGIAGTLWSIYGTVLEVNKKVAVMAVTIENTSSNLKSYLIRYERKSDQVDGRLNKVEQGETYYRYHDKIERQKKEVVK